MYKTLLPSFFLFLILLIPTTLEAQSSLNASDLSRVRAAEVTDAQLRNFMSQAEAQGMSVDQALQMAQQRGLPPSEASQLSQRLRELQATGGVQDRGLRQQDGELREERQREFVRPDREETELMERTFGNNAFRMQATEFAPTSNIATPSSYTLGPGDELLISIWGDQTANYRLLVGPEGSVEIDNLGPVQVSGLTLAQAEEAVKSNLRQLFAGMRGSDDQQTTFARVSINRLRSIQVAITGDVVNPGNYAITSGSTVFNALYRAGGPAENGSYRRVRVVRDNEILTETDLYVLLADGLQTGNVALRDGDVVHVLPYQNRIEVIGAARRGDLFYETKEGETLTDLLHYAGGFSANAFRQQVRIHRNTLTERRILTVDQSRFDQTVLQNGDVVFIDELPERFENRVAIEGAVWRSGDYELRSGMTLSELIEEAGGLRPDVFMNRGLINRLRDDFTLKQISFDLARLMEQPERYDILLRPEDQVLIRSIHNLADEQTVEISGAVRNGGRFPYRDAMTLEDLILKADGFSSAASEARIEISRRVTDAPESEWRRSSTISEVYTFSVARDLTITDEAEQFRLQPYDQVQIFRNPAYREQITVTIEGQVLFPGTYTLQSRNERISDVIRRAGGLTEEAYLPGARLTRPLSSIDRPEIELDFLSAQERFEGTLTATQTVDLRNTTRMVEAERDTLRNGEEREERGTLEQRTYINRLGMIEQDAEEEEEYRRIGLNLEQIMRRPGSSEDLFLREGDVIRIPEQQQTVAILGAVMQDVEVRFQEGRGLNYYINRAGGFTRDAQQGRAYVVYANGDVERRRRYLFGLIKNNPPIEPGAQIIVPERPPREGMSTAEIISVSATVVSMSTTLLLAIDRYRR